MFEVDGLDINCVNFDIEEYVESKTTKIEVGDNFAIVANELENGDPFYLILCNKPLPYYLITFKMNGVTHGMKVVSYWVVYGTTMF
jgi:hypothetical protein